MVSGVRCNYSLGRRFSTWLYPNTWLFYYSIQTLTDHSLNNTEAETKLK